MFLCRIVLYIDQCKRVKSDTNEYNISNKHFWSNRGLLNIMSLFNDLSKFSFNSIFKFYGLKLVQSPYILFLDLHLPTKPLNESMCIFKDLARKFNHINSLENYVVGLHWVWSSERRAAKGKKKKTYWQCTKGHRHRFTQIFDHWDNVS